MKKIALFFCVLFAAPILALVDGEWPFPPDTISTPGVDASAQQVAVDINGNVVAVWIENTLVKSSSATMSGSWGSINTLSGSGASDPQVKIDLNGTSTAIWIESGVVQASELVLNGSWSAPSAISGSGASFPELAIDSTGNLVATWLEGGAVLSATKLYGGSWPVSPDTLSSTGASSPRVAIGAEGTVIAVWQGTIGATPTIYSASKSIAGAWGAEVAISSGGVNSSYPQIAVDSVGNAVSIWYRYDLSGSLYSNVVVQSSSMPSGGGWSSPVDVSSAGVRNPADLVSSVVAGPNSTAFAAWTNSMNGSLFDCQWSVLSSGSWSSPGTFVSMNLLAYDLDMAVIPKGDAAIVWMVYDPSSSILSIQTAINDLSSMSKILFNPTIISNSSSNAYPTIAYNATSTDIYSVAAWVSFDSVNDVIQCTRADFVYTQPPSNLVLSSQTNDYGVVSEISNVLSWTASISPNVENYLVFRDGVYLGWTASNDCQFTDPNRTIGQTVIYSVAATDSQGGQSAFISKTIIN